MPANPAPPAMRRGLTDAEFRPRYGKRIVPIDLPGDAKAAMHDLAIRRAMPLYQHGIKFDHTIHDIIASIYLQGIIDGAEAKND